MTAWKSGVIKGTTTYRAGTAMAVMKEVSTEKPKTKETEKPNYKKFKRNTKNPSQTYKIKTPEGNIYITIVSQEKQPCEVFLSAGKHTQFISEWLVSIGRMCSLYLQDTSLGNKREALKLIADNLRGINSENTIWAGKKVLRSVPDAIAQVFYDFLDKESLEDSSIPVPGDTKKDGEKFKCPKCKAMIPFKPGCENPPCPSCSFEGKCG